MRHFELQLSLVVRGMAVLALILLTPGITRADDQAAPVLMPARTFNSPLALTVYVRTDEGDSGRRVLGRTPAVQPLQIPACLGWEVQPAAGTGLDDVIKEMQAQSIPGLSLAAATDDNLVKVKVLTGLRLLDLGHGKITDAGMANLKDLRDLQVLGLLWTRVTEAGMAQLKDLTKLEWLCVAATAIPTDAGMATISNYTELRHLDMGVTGNHLTDAGAANFAKLTKLKQLDLNGTEATDVALGSIQNLKDLQWLGLAGTKVTDAGLAHLKGLTHLKEVGVRKSQVTAAGVADLQQALPGCKIEFKPVVEPAAGDTTRK